MFEPQVPVRLFDKKRFAVQSRGREIYCVDKQKYLSILLELHEILSGCESEIEKE
jgi:hypothetical protein